MSCQAPEFYADSFIYIYADVLIHMAQGYTQCECFPLLVFTGTGWMSSRFLTTSG